MLLFSMAASRGIKKGVVSRTVVRSPSFHVSERHRYRRGPLADVWSSLLWVVGILVSLAVGFGMVNGALTIPFIPSVLTALAGWIVIILTLLGVLLKIIDVISMV